MRILKNGELVGAITTNRSMTISEAMELLNYEWVHDANDGDHFRDNAGNEAWIEELVMTDKMSFEEFENAITTEYGSSRDATNDYGVSWILLKNDDGEEIFYAECNEDLVCTRAGIDLRKDPDEIYDACREARDAYDDTFIKNAYNAYLEGDEEYYE